MRSRMICPGLGMVTLLVSGGSSAFMPRKFLGRQDTGLQIGAGAEFARDRRRAGTDEANLLAIDAIGDELLAADDGDDAEQLAFMIGQRSGQGGDAEQRLAGRELVELLADARQVRADRRRIDDGARREPRQLALEEAVL